MKNVLTFYLNRERIMWNSRLTFLDRKMVMRNGILGISVGAYCICPYRMSPKETYDQKSRYMWGVCNTPLPWRTRRSISKINFKVMQNEITLFWSKKWLCRIDCPSIWIEKGVCEMAQPFFDLKNCHAKLQISFFDLKKWSYKIDYPSIWIEKWSC